MDSIALQAYVLTAVQHLSVIQAIYLKQAI